MKWLPDRISSLGAAGRGLLLFLVGIGATVGVMFPLTAEGGGKEPTNPLMREFVITIDPTALEPPTWWHVPGVTPLIWTMDPVSSDAYKTTEAHKIKLKPGEYRFGTFTFDFAFRVTLNGVLDFSQTLSQCVEGRGTEKLTVRCSHTQPYVQEPDYHYE